jgi:CubicO group peptidase (beta-lactamase class C family)
MIVTDWQGRHGLDAAAHQAAFDDLVDRGYRLVKITSYDANGTARYASIWHRQNGNRWRALHGVSEDEYQAAIDNLWAEGYRPVDLSVVRSGGVTRFSAIWEQEAGPDWIARHRLTAAQYQQLFDDLSGLGYRLRCVSPYDNGDGERFACIWDRYAGPPWRARHGLRPEEYQTEFDRQLESGFRLVRSVGYDSGFGARYATIWERSPGYPWRARHGLPDANYQAEFDAGVRENMLLVDLSGFRNGESVAYTTIWEQGAWAPERRGPVSDRMVPFMQKWAAPGFSLAVARNGLLRAAHCIGYANRITREIVTPDTRLRLASLAKPITSTAVHLLIEQGRLGLTDRVFGTGGLLGTTFGTLPYNARVLQITVQHLLEHSSGGWTNDATDPMFQQPGLSQADLISWTLDNVPLTSDPGTRYAYSNFGYCLLGRIIERVSARSYGDFVRKFVLNPAGASQVVLAGRSAAERVYPEAMYFGMFPAAPYGLRIDRMDAHGGWVGSPTDVLQFLARVDTRTPPPDLLQPATITAMTTASAVKPAVPGGDPGYARGWAVDDDGTVLHDGILPGTQAVLVQAADGRQWCAACSAGRPGTALAGEFSALMWQVQAVA